MYSTFEISHRSYKTKHTKVGDIPKDWNLDKLRKNAIVLFSNVDKHIHEDEIPVFLCNYQDVYYHDYINSAIPFSAGSVKPSEFHKFQLHKGDVIITKDSEDRKDIAVPAYVIEEIPNLICGYHLAILRPNESRLDGIFLSFLLQSHNINHYFQKLANGVTRFGLTADSIKNALIPVPPLPEQQKIAEILSTWDLAISTTNSLIEELKLRNKGLAQQLLTGKKRLKGFEGEWEEQHLEHYFNERKETNYPELPLLSVGEIGVYPQIESNKKDTSNENKSKYKRICPGDIGYNTMRMWQGRSALSSLEGIVSPAYTIVTPKKNADAHFFAYLFKLDEIIHKFFRKSQGLVSDTLNCKFKDFKIVQVLTPPSIDEQKAITKVLQKADNELKLHQQQLDTLKEQKKGLMQKLLTGKIRVNI